MNYTTIQVVNIPKQVLECLLFSMLVAWSSPKKKKKEADLHLHSFWGVKLSPALWSNSSVCLFFSSAEWKWDMRCFWITMFCENLPLSVEIWSIKRVLAKRNKEHTPEPRVSSLFRTHNWQGLKGANSLFFVFLSLVCGDLLLALHDVDVCGCVFMHGTKWSLQYVF